jgi:hypothetical protein
MCRRLVEELLGQAVDQACQVEYKVVAPSNDSLLTDAASTTSLAAGAGQSETHGAWADDPLVQAARQMGAEVRPIDEGRET